VEISLDDGRTWNLASIVYPEEHFRTTVYSDSIFGRVDLSDSESSFCWCFWSYEIPIAELNDCDVISVRCMDEALALQPRDMYWNATGMMNNWYALFYALFVLIC
jgi:nitrate reductase (NAD(P)H)